MERFNGLYTIHSEMLVRMAGAQLSLQGSGNPLRCGHDADQKAQNQSFDTD